MAANYYGAIWIPDWQVSVAQQRVQLELPAPIALADGRDVKEANAYARSLGIRVGMSLKRARALAPQLAVLDANARDELQALDSVIAAAHQDVAQVAVVRPGLLTFAARGPVRFAGGEEQLASNLIGAVATEAGYEAHIGFAHHYLAALVAAHSDAYIPLEETGKFVRSLPLTQLLWAGVRGRDDRAVLEMLRQLHDLGVRRIGKFLDLEESAVRMRFPEAADAVYSLIRDTADVFPKISDTSELYSVRRDFEEPVLEMEGLAFVARAMAVEFVAGLSQRRRTVQSVTIVVRWAVEELGDDGAGAYVGGEREREITWRIFEVSEAEITRRMRWQLSAWVDRARSSSPHSRGGIVGVELYCSQLLPEESAQAALWGERRQVSRQTATQAVAQIQSVIGAQGVKRCVPESSPTPVEAAVLKDWDDEVPSGARQRKDAGPWPGGVPRPWPSKLEKELEIRLYDAAGHECHISGLGLFSCAHGCHDPFPVAVKLPQGAVKVSEYAGPWLREAQWWSGLGNSHAWCQIITEIGSGLLCSYEAGKWRAVGSYE